MNPVAFRERDAGAYTGFSAPHLRKLRLADQRRLKKGEPIQGPHWAVIGCSIRYIREDLDAWVNSHRINAKQAEPKGVAMP